MNKTDTPAPRSAPFERSVLPIHNIARFRATAEESAAPAASAHARKPVARKRRK